MRIMEVDRAPRKETPHRVDVRPLLGNRHLDAVHIQLEPGEALKRHITPVDAFFYVLEGTPGVEIDSETTEVGPDTMIESPAGIPHRIFNDGNSRARILVMKVPKPTEATQVL